MDSNQSTYTSSCSLLKDACGTRDGMRSLESSWAGWHPREREREKNARGYTATRARGWSDIKWIHRREPYKLFSVCFPVSPFRSRNFFEFSLECSWRRESTYVICLLPPSRCRYDKDSFRFSFLFDWWTDPVSRVSGIPFSQFLQFF